MPSAGIRREEGAGRGESSRRLTGLATKRRDETSGQLQEDGASRKELKVSMIPTRGKNLVRREKMDSAKEHRRAGSREG